MSFVPSVLGRAFPDALNIMAGAGVQVATTNNNPGNPATLVLNGSSGSTPMLMADNTLITADDTQDFADANPPLLPAPYILWQSPAPGTQFTPGTTVICSFVGVGYPVPTPSGNVPVP